MRREELAYLAGIIDGEGSIRIERSTRNYYRLRISVANTSIALMKWLQKKCGNTFIKERKRKGNRRQQYQWDSNRLFDVVTLLTDLLPYLIIKHDHSLVALEFAEIKKSRKRRYSDKQKKEIVLLFEKMKVLNSRGL